MNRISSCFAATLFLLLLSGTSGADVGQAIKAENDIVEYSGYYIREGNDGKTAKLSGKSHYLKFFPDNRIIRLYIPYPYSTTLSPATIRKVFQAANEKSTTSAFLRDDFGLLDERIVAHLDSIKRINGEILYDCGSSAPCRIEFLDGALKTIKQAIVGEHIIRYEHVKD